MTESGKRMLELSTQKNLSNQQRKQLVTLLRANGADMPDCMLENAYQLYQNDPKSDQRYIQLQQIIYSGLKLKIDRSVVRKFVLHMRKKLGDNTYIRRLTRFVQYISSPQMDVAPIQDLLADDLSDNQTLKKTITSFKRMGKIDEYIQRMNKYLSIEPLDEEAWLELAEIYTQKGYYMKAAFCYEQLIIINPANDIYHLKLSELYLTLGNKSTTDKAIKYLSFLVTKRPDNLRALWVLHRAIGNNEQYQQLKQMCYEVINKLYSKKNPELKINLAF